MAVVTAPRLAGTANPMVRRWVGPVAAFLAFVVAWKLANRGGLTFGDTPTWLDAHIKPWFDQLYKWIVRNNTKNWLFTGFLTPISHALRWVVSGKNDNVGVLWVLHTLRWPGVLALVGVVGAKTGGRRAAIVGVLTLAGCGVLGFWDATMVSLALMIVSVAISVLIGVPVGIWAGLSDRAEKAIKGILDTAQVLPAYVYLLPAVVLFGIGNAGAVVATVIFAVAPAIRLTSLGIRNVPVVANEVGTAFGSTRLQLLKKVQLPMARRAMLLGLNQVIVMAFGILVLAAVVGAGGLGQAINEGLRKNDVGLTFVPGVCIVLAAIALDRITTGERKASSSSRFQTLLPSATHRLVTAVIAVLGVALIAKMVGASSFPKGWQIKTAKPVNSFVNWINNHIRKGVPLIGGTGTIDDVLVRDILIPLRNTFQYVAWWLTVVIVAFIGWLSGGKKLALLCGFCMLGIVSLRMWDLAMDTLSQVLVAVLISVALAIPIGILAGRSNAVERALRPILDAAQVLPPFVYLVPVAFLFHVGPVPGVIASVIYALPPGIRLTSLGLREVSYATREAAISFGATPRQELFKVQLPLAFRSVMLGINQTILMVFSMVIISALIGAGGLGLQAVYGLTKKEIGTGVAGGMSIVLLAIVLDRLTQAWGSRSGVDPSRNV